MRAAPSILVASITTLLLACSDSTGPSLPPSHRTPSTPDAGSFQVAPSTATLQHGQTLQFTTAYAGNLAVSGWPGTVSWRSSDESVATVSPNGLVRGVSGGQARIIATSGVYQASAVVTVTGSIEKHEGPAVCLERIPRGERLLIPQC
jgi:hypothetical protein